MVQIFKMNLLEKYILEPVLLNEQLVYELLDVYPNHFKLFRKRLKGRILRTDKKGENKMNELMKFEKEIDKITSLELVEQINIFRKQENKNESGHNDLLKIIRDEFEEEIGVGKISQTSYTHQQNKQEYPMFILSLSEARQVLTRESKFVRKAVIKWIEMLEEKYNKPEFILMKANQIQQKMIEDAKKEIKSIRLELEYKKEILEGITENIDVYKKKDILNRVVRHKGANYRERWSELYKVFKEMYHIDLKARKEGYNATQFKNKDKCKSIVEYSVKFGYIEKLYEISLKLYETDMNEIISQIKQIS